MSASAVPLRVYVRARPLSSKELREKSSSCLQFYTAANQICCNGNKYFTFDAVLDPSTSQVSAFEVTSLTSLEQFFKGFNCTMIAYGQTGSGKTFTMGTEETVGNIKSDNRGIIPRLMTTIFDRIQESEDIQFEVRVSMLEIYDEKVNDLLSSQRDLPVRELNGTVQVQGLTAALVKNVSETMSQLERGCQLRSKGETAMNATSSRSHAIFTVELSRVALTEEQPSANFTAKLHLVDLAGSERLKKTQAEGDRMKEGIRINEGLLALGNVISALSEPASHKHIPYRDSKITRLLQDSLGGNSYTVMIACVSPADSNADETLSTLRYADRAKRIKNKPIVNVDPDKLMIKNLSEQLALAQKALAEYRAGLCPSSDTNSIAVHELQEKCIAAENKCKLVENKYTDLLYKNTQLIRDKERFEDGYDQLKKLVEADGKCDLEPAVHKIREIIDQVSNEELEENEISQLPHTDDVDVDDDADVPTNFAETQTVLNNKIGELNMQIKRAEAFVHQECKEGENLELVMRQNKVQVSKLQEAVSALTKEKEKLEEELRKSATKNRLAEERRQRLAVLEKEIALQKKQLNEMNKISQQKARVEENMKKFQQEITSLKQARVQAMKQSKQEADKYRKWKMDTERKLAVLQSKDKKREGQVARDKLAATQQMTILRQNLEDLKSWKKRELAKQKRPARTISGNEGAKPPKEIRLLFNDMLRDVAEKYRGRQLLQQLISGRKKIAAEQSRLKKQCRSLEQQSSAINPLDNYEDEIAEKKEKLKHLESELLVITAEIKEMQGKLGDVDEAEEAALLEKMWHSFDTPDYAQTALKIMFEAASNFRMNIVDLQLQHEAIQTVTKTIRAELQETKAEHSKEKSELVERYSNLENRLMQKAYDASQKASMILARLSEEPNIPTTQFDMLRHTIEKFDIDITKAAESIKEEIERCATKPRRSKALPTPTQQGLIIEGPRARSKTTHYGDARNTLAVIETPSIKTRRLTKKHSNIPMFDSPEHDDHAKENVPTTSRAVASCSLRLSFGENENPLNMTMVIDSKKSRHEPEDAANSTFIVDDRRSTTGDKNIEAAEPPKLTIPKRATRDISGGMLGKLLQ